ncbi:MAG: glycosyltransferase [Nanoarchaeota archaeon]
MKKVTFLIAAHNEEKHIAEVLDNLKNLKKSFPNIEVIVGNDGSTDKTSSIVDKYKFVKHVHLNERKGKHAVINKIIKLAKSEIIIVHDADWIFKVNNPEDFELMISWFDDPIVGGVAESFPIEYETGIKNNSLAYLGNLYGNFLWIEFLKKRYTNVKNGLRIVDSKNGFPFLVNVFRKRLYKENTTLGDDFERSLEILNNDYNVVVVDNPKLPRMHTLTYTMSFKDILKQKTRTAKARDQVFSKYNVHINFFNFYIPLLFFYILNIHKTRSFKAAFSLFLWIIIFIYGSVVSKFKNRNLSTEKGWLMRAQR